MEFTAAVSQGLELANLLLVTCLVLVLTVIAANIGNLVFTRTIARARELAVRTALGATRVRLVGQVFAEVAIVGVVAAAIGLVASQAALAWTRNTLTDMPFWVTFSASPRTMMFVGCATLLTACVGGVAPALRATRRDPAELLAATTRGTSIGLGRMSSVLVTVQVALSIALLNSALLMARGVAGYMNPTIHVPVHEVLTARVVSETTAATAIEQTAAAMPGVAAAGVSSSLPGLSPPTRMTIVERVAESVGPMAPRAAPVAAVGPGFFNTFGARLESGRLFSASDFAANAAPVAVVNRPFVDKFFDGHDPIGRRIRAVDADASEPAEPWREVVGVVPDLGLSAGDENLAAGYYVPIAREAVFHLALRTSGDARRLSAPLRSALNDLDPQVQLRQVVSLDTIGLEDRAVFAGIGAALATLGGIALLLTVIGAYAILSLSVTRRTREIGVRTSLGATRRQVLQSLLGRTALPPAIGAVAGVALGQALVPMRSIFAFRLPDGSGPWGLPILGAIMVTAAIVAAWVPVRRALAIDPAEALRSG